MKKSIWEICKSTWFKCWCFWLLLLICFCVFFYIKNSKVVMVEENHQLDDFVWEDISIADPDDPSKWFTIMDRNLWATTTWAWENAPITSYWYYYQWWNNYGFDSQWKLSDVKKRKMVRVSPEKWYTSSTFIKGNRDWAITSNRGLRWWEWDYEHNNRWLDNLVQTVENRQWPCPEWYHVPSVWEWSNVFECWCKNNSDKCTMSNMQQYQGIYYNYSDYPIGTNFAAALNIPFAGWRDYSSASVRNQGDYALLWSSSPDDTRARFLRLRSSNVYADSRNYRAYGFPVRCFKDSYIPSSLNS